MSDNFVALQKQIREQNQRLQDYISDLNKWEDTIKRKDSNLLNKDESSHNFPPIRGSSAEKPKEQETDTTTKPKSDNNVTNNEKPIKPKSYTEYSKWEQLDVDKALKEIDEKQDLQDQQKHEQKQEEREKQANKIKERGNKEFKGKEYSSALKSYSEALKFSPNNSVILSNRAMALIKLGRYSEAEQDASKAISFDKNYAKAYNRRATANKHLGKYKEALEDLNVLSGLKPGSKQVKKEIEQIKLEQEKSKSELKTKKPKPKGKKYTIQEVESESSSQETPPTINKSKQKSTTDAESNNQQNNVKQRDNVTENSSIMMKNIGANIEVPDSPPKNGYEFERVLHSLQGGTRKQLYQYIKMISPEQLPDLLDVFLDSDTLMLFFSIIKEFFLSDNSKFRDIAHGFNILKFLAKTNRFDMTLMFLESNELNELRETFKLLEQNFESSGLSHSDFKSLKEIYDL